MGLLLNLVGCSSVLPNKWETGDLSPGNPNEWPYLDSVVLEVPDSLASPFVEKLADKPFFEMDASERRELGLAGIPSRLFLIRGIRIGKTRFCTEVFWNSKNQTIYVRRRTLEPEFWFPFKSADTSYPSPVVVALDLEPKKVFVHAEKSGDRSLRNAKCRDQMFPAHEQTDWAEKGQ